MPVPAVACIVTGILRVHVVDYKCGTEACLTDIVFSTGTETQLSLLPLQSHPGLGERTAKDDILPLLCPLTLKLLGENDREG